LQHLLPLNDSDRRAIAWVRRQVWLLYPDLKAYRQHPDPAAKDHLTAGFGALCATDITFASLKETCRKHGISFWEYLKDRVSGRGAIPSLGELIRQAATP
jgi:hypothetical protein